MSITSNPHPAKWSLLTTESSTIAPEYLYLDPELPPIIPKAYPKPAPTFRTALLMNLHDKAHSKASTKMSRRVAKRVAMTKSLRRDTFLKRRREDYLNMKSETEKLIGGKSGLRDIREEGA
jgi:hypothetical protein